MFILFNKLFNNFAIRRNNISYSKRNQAEGISEQTGIYELIGIWLREIFKLASEMTRHYKVPNICNCLSNADPGQEFI